MKMHQFGLSVIFIAAVFFGCSQKEILTEVQNANVIAESDNLIKDKINVADEVYARKFADFKERKLPLFRNSMQTKKNNEEKIEKNAEDFFAKLRHISVYDLPQFMKEPLECLENIQIIQGEFNETGIDSENKISIKYLGNQKVEVNANWKMFHSKEVYDLDTVINTDFLHLSGSRDGVTVDYKLYFEGNVLKYSFRGVYFNFDKNDQPVNRRESKVDITLKKIR